MVRERKNNRGAAGRPKDSTKFKFHHHYSRQIGPRSGLGVGHRGYSRLPWRRGPREPLLPQLGSPNDGRSFTTLFIDGLYRELSPAYLKSLFEQHGAVEEVFISKKVRNNRKDAFGFVRYGSAEKADLAIRKLNGHVISDARISVSYAKYQKGGSPFSKELPVRKKKSTSSKERWIKKPALRDDRKYVEVVLGKQKTISEQEKALVQPQISAINEVNGIEKVQTKGKKNTKSSLIVSENSTMTEKLKNALVVYFKEPTNPKQAAEWVIELNVPCVCMSSISPLSLILFFESDIDTKDAMEEVSSLWKFFKNIRRWSENDRYNERLTWIECYGLHPKCWSLENIKRIGEQWGSVIHVDHEDNGLNSLTFARLLIRTTAQFRVDACIRLEWETGDCDIWVKETNGCRGSTMHETNHYEPVNTIDDKVNSSNLEAGNSSSKLWVSETRDEGGYEQVVTKSVQGYQQRIEGCYEDLLLADIMSKPLGRGETPPQQPKTVTKTIPSDCSVELVNESIDHENVGAVAVNNEGLNTVVNHVSINHDPVVDIFVGVVNVTQEEDRIDPIASVEIVGGGCLPVSHGIATNTLIEHSMIPESSTKRSRRHPRKRSGQSHGGTPVSDQPSLNCLVEAQKTWATAKLLGISSCDEGAVISELRISKRLQLLAEDTA
ncbi:unnamed protein product [Amaranthus hypochondriacus]